MNIVIARTTATAAKKHSKSVVGNVITAPTRFLLVTKLVAAATGIVIDVRCRTRDMAKVSFLLVP